MKTLIVLLLSLTLTACNEGDGGGGGSTSTAAIKAPVSNPVAQDPTSSPPVTCAALIGTKWVISGSPTLTLESQDQAGQAPYIASIDLSVANPSFVEHQFVAGFGTMSCTRTWSAATEVVPGTYFWADTTGQCGAVAQMIQINDSQCNQITVIIRDGSSNIYETATYIPN